MLGRVRWSLCWSVRSVRQQSENIDFLDPVGGPWDFSDFDKVQNGKTKNENGDPLGPPFLPSKRVETPTTTPPPGAIFKPNPTATKDGYWVTQYIGYPRIDRFLGGPPQETILGSPDSFVAWRPNIPSGLWDPFFPAALRAATDPIIGPDN